MLFSRVGKALSGMVLHAALFAAAGADTPVTETGETKAAGEAAAADARPATPADAADPEVRRLWALSQQLEDRDDLDGAAALRETLAARLPSDAHLRWRIARDLVRAAEGLPAEDRAERLARYERALDWARQGREVDPACAECCLYEFAALGRISTTRGPLYAVRNLRATGRVLRECLAAPPTWSDSPTNQERGNLYYGAASFYRLVPDSFMVRWMSGIRGDPAEAVRLARLAVATTPARIDYNLELAAALLCLAERQGDAAARAEGLAVLARIEPLPDLLPTDAADRRLALELAASPERACDFSRDGWFDEKTDDAGPHPD